MEVFNAVDPEAVMITGIRAKVTDFFTKLVYSGFNTIKMKFALTYYLYISTSSFMEKQPIIRNP